VERAGVNRAYYRSLQSLSKLVWI